MYIVRSFCTLLVAHTIRSLRITTYWKRRTFQDVRYTVFFYFLVAHTVRSLRTATSWGRESEVFTYWDVFREGEWILHVFRRISGGRAKFLRIETYLGKENESLRIQTYWDVLRKTSLSLPISFMYWERPHSPSLSLCLSLPLCLPHSLSLSLPPSLSVSLSLSLCLSISHGLARCGLIL